MLRPVALLFALILALPLSAQLFVERAAVHGLNLDGIKDGGFSFGDLNGDGWLDLIVNTDQDDAAHRTRVYFSSGPPSWFFTDVTATHCRGCQEPAAFDGAPERSLVLADFNRDGYPDFVRNSARRLEVFLNKGPAPGDGDPPFSFGDALQQPNFALFTSSITDPNPPFGIPGGMNTEGVGVLDYDGDGDLDLFIENHDWGMDIYQNVGFATGSFVHVTPNEASLGLPIAATDGDYAAVTDLDNDGWVDAIARKRDQLDLFRNTGGAFAPVSGFNEQASNSNKGAVAFYDLDNDGDFDLVWTENDNNQIWIQQGTGSGFFTPSGEPWISAGLSDPFSGLAPGIDGAAAGDIDNDGDLDLFFADGSGPSYLFINQLSETGTLAFVRSNMGMDVQADAEGCQFVDLDQDGDLDLYININGGDNQLWINTLNDSSEPLDYLVVRVLDNRNAAGAADAIERDALGATLRLFGCEGDPLSGIREVNGGYGHGNQENSLVHFGLPLGAEREYVLEVRYPIRDGNRVVVRRPVVPASLAPGAPLVIRPQDGDTPCNAGPLALPDFAQGCPGQALELFPLANDSDPDGLPLDPAAWVLVEGPFAGSASFDPLSGQLLYTPDSADVLADSLRYRICDAAGACAEAWVYVSFEDNLLLDALVQQPFCPGFADGAIALSVSGGQFPYQFQWSTGDTGSALIELPAGTYAVLVEDALGCTQTASYLLTDPDSLLLSLSATDASSAGSCDGSAAVSIIGGSAPYSLVWSPGGQTDSLISGLCAGAYVVNVTDAKGCTAFGSAVVNAPECDLGAEVLTTDPPCAGEAGGSALAIPSGGVGPYTYLWLPGGQLSASVDSLAAGSYALLVEDAQGCAVQVFFELAEPEPLVLALSAVGVSEPGASDGTASVLASGGTPPYTYLWSNGAGTPSISGLSAGVYSVLVSDAAGCTAVGMISVPGPDCDLSLNLLTQDVRCAGEANGSLTALVSSGTPPYSYLWSTGDTSSSLSGLAPGVYGLAVSDAVGCSATAMAALSEPLPLLASATSQAPLCQGDANGQISTTASGGNPPYLFTWSDGFEGPERTGLEAGTYSAVVSDAKGCTDTLVVVLPEGSLLSLEGSVVQAERCFGASDGSILAQASGGVPPYTYFWPELGSVLAFQSDLAPGSYTVQASDAAGCSVEAVLVVEPATPLGLTALVQDAGCAGDSLGSVLLSLSGGQAPYVYLWSDGQSDSVAVGLGPGLYSVVVTDALGCTASGSFTVGLSSALTVSLLGLEPVCGSEDGQISALVSGAAGPLSYLWSDGQTGPVALDLGAGFYSVQVSDGVCQAMASLALGTSGGPSLVLSAEGSSCSGSDGTALVLASGGSPPYSFLWSDGQTTAEALNLAPGAYTVLVSDSAGCATAGTVTVPELNSLALAAAVIPPSGCGLSNGLANASASGGTPPYSYLWSNGDTLALSDSLSAGLYTVLVTDALGCTASAQVLVADGFGLGLSVSVTGASCGEPDGTASVSVAGGSPPYSFQWSDGQTGPVASGLSPGSYAVEVTDGSGCRDLALVEVPGSEGLVALLSAAAPGCSGSDGSLSVAVLGGSPPVSILWSTGETGSAISGLSPGSYSVTLSDAAGCTVSDSVVLEGADPLDLLLSSSPVSATGASDGTAAVLVAGGSPPYTFLWSPGGQTDPSISGLEPGIYTVLVTDAAGCTAEASVTVADAPCNLMVDISATPAGCSGTATGSAAALPSGGSPPYAYLWSNGQTGPVAFGLAPGTYSVSVSDAAGCTASASVVIVVAPPLELSASISPSGCAGDSLGSVLLSLSGGQAPYVYLWSDGQSDSVAVGLGPGLYSVVVTDALGCTASGSFTVGLSSALTVSLLGLEPVCGSEDGQISALVSGAAGPLSYLWSDGQTGPVALDLGAGFYSVQVSDGVCQAMASLALGTSGGPSLVLSAEGSSCSGSDGTALVLASGGSPPYSFLWSDGQTTAEALNLAPGAYTVLVSDSAGCATAGTVTVPELNSLALAAAVIPPSGCGLSNGLANASASGGTPPYSYLWSNGDTLALSDSLSAGLYTVLVTDALGCTASAQVLVADGFGLGLSVSVTGASCGEPDGTASVSVAGGSPPYSFQWSDGQTGPVASGLSPGSYAVEVTDGSGCRDLALVEVPGSEGLVALLSAAAPGCSGSDGSLSVAVLGGSPPVSILWSTGETGSAISGLSPGSYSVTLSDAAGCTVSDSITLALDCADVPLAVRDTVATHEAEFLLIRVLVNDSDPGGAPGPPELITPPLNGSAVVLADSSLGYLPNPGFLGVDSLRYQICNASGCSQAWVIIYVGIGNNPPVAQPDAAVTPPNTPVLIGVGVNDFDPDGDELTWALYEAPLHGSAMLGSGQALYVPAPTFAGPDRLLYVLCDPAGLCDTALVQILVEGPGGGLPLAFDDAASTLPNTERLVPVLLNDLGGAFPLNSTSLSLTGGPEQGIAFEEPAGLIRYQPFPGFSGPDSLTYQVCNTGGFCDEAVLRIRVGSIDNPPLAVNDLSTTPAGTPVLVPILANDSDPDGDLLAPSISISPLNGIASLLPDGSLLYAPEPGFFGLDALTYLLCDAGGLCDDAVVFIDVTLVNNPPVAADDYGSTSPGAPLTVSVLANDSDPDGDLLSVTLVAGPIAGGSAVINADGSITYVPGPDGITDELTYAVCDPEGLCDTARLVVTVGSTDNPPVVVDDSTSTLACMLVVAEVLLNDADPDGDPLVISLLSAPAVGEALATDDQKVVYFPPDGFTGLVQITYQACDPQGNCSEGLLTIHVIPPYLPPAALDDFYALEAGSVLGVDLLLNDFHPNGNPLSGPFLVEGPFNGSATVNPDGSLTYTPDPGFSGLDSLRYAICDDLLSCLGDLRCDTAWAWFTVRDPDPGDGPNRPPVALDDEVSTDPSTPVLVVVLANDFDPDGDPLLVELISAPLNGAAVLNTDGSVTFTPNTGFEGCDSFLYRICDPGGLCDTAQVLICIQPGFFVPDVITPNADGSNDTWIITGLENFPNNGVTVYNRWGDEVFSAQPYLNNWAGTHRDRGDLPDGTYYYILNLGDGSTPTAGFITLFR